MSTLRSDDSRATVPGGQMRVAGDYVVAMHGVLDAIPVDEVIELAQLVYTVTVKGHAVYVFGNGGSAATADHIACDLSKNTQVVGAPPVRCLCLGSMLATTSALANDLSYSMVFAEQLRLWGRPGDVALAVTTSGNSPNVLEGLATARQLGLHTAALLGFRGGAALNLVDIPIVVGSESVPQLEDAHNVVNHMLTNCLKSMLQARVAEAHLGLVSLVEWHDVEVGKPDAWEQVKAAHDGAGEAGPSKLILGGN